MALQFKSKLSLSVIYSNETSCLHSINYSLPVKLGVLRPDRYHERKTFHGLESQMVMVNNPWIIIVLRNRIDLQYLFTNVWFNKVRSLIRLVSIRRWNPMPSTRISHRGHLQSVDIDPLFHKHIHNRRNMWSNKYYINGSYLITTDRGRKSGSFFCVWKLHKSIPKILSIPFFCKK